MLSVAGCTVFTQAQRNKELESESAQPGPSDTETSESKVPDPASTESADPASQATVKLEVAGSGNKTTEKFTVGPEWTVEWSYECSDELGPIGIFQMFPKGDVDLLPVMSNLEKLNASDTQNYHEAGEFYLDILSNCDWTITVRG